MIAFYVVSNTAIINAIDVKDNYFPHEEADIYIRYVNGTSLNLVNAIKRAGVFSNVYLFPFPDPARLQVKIGKRVRSLPYRKVKKTNDFIVHYLDPLIKDQKYTHLLTLHMDSHCFYFANYFENINKDLGIQFFEDGNASYLCDRKYLINTIWLGERRISFLIRKISEFPYRLKSRKNISSVMYLRNPEIYNPVRGFDVKRINFCDISEQVLSSIYESLDPNLVLRYSKATVIYIANAITWAERSYDFAYVIIGAILKVINGKQMIIKTHSSASTTNKLAFAKQFEKKFLWIERSISWKVCC